MTNEVIKKEEFTPERTKEAILKFPNELQPIKSLFAQPWEAFRSAFKDPVEADIIMHRETTFAAEAMLNNTYLIQCAQKFPIEFVNALKNVALSGLSLSPTLKQGYLVPFKGKVSFMPSYMGLVDLVANNGHVKKFEAFLVFTGDEFEMQHGTEEKLIHKPDPWGVHTEETMLGGYWIAELTDGTKLFDSMSKADIEIIKKRSPSVAKGQSSPWQTDTLEMCRKTVLRRGFKSLPKGSISDDKLKVLDAAFDYAEKEEQAWIKESENKASKTSRYDFDESEDVAEFEEVPTEVITQPKEEAF